MTEKLENLVANGVRVGENGWFSLTPTAEALLPLVAESTREQDEIRYEMNSFTHKYADAVHMLAYIDGLSATIRRLIGLKASLYKRLLEAQKERVWTLKDLDALQNLRYGKNWLASRANVEKAIKDGKLTADEYAVIENILGSGPYGLISEFRNIPDDAKGGIKRAMFDQSFLNKKGKYDSVAIYCLVKPVGKKWEIIHAEYPDAAAPKHVGRIKLTHGLYFY